MARPVILGNGALTVGLDESGFVHDFYYPYVGLDNLTNARNNPHYIGIWVNGRFTWLSDDAWTKEINFRDESLISSCNYTNNELNIVVKLEDFVVHDDNIFARKMHIVNNSADEVEIRVFFYQVFQISADGRADTALYVPGEDNYILDYKGRCSILAYAEDSRGKSFDQHAVGNTGIEGKLGTYKDAEDGELSNSNIEHSSVDSTIRCSLRLSGNSSDEIYYWLAVSNSQDHLEELNSSMKNGGFNKRMSETENYWREWLSIASDKLTGVNIKYRSIVNKSLMIIKAHTDKHGGVIASCDSSIYNYGRDYYSYVWPRDGAYAMWPLIRLGYTEEPKKFFKFCASILSKNGYLKHKFQPDKAVGSTWHPLEHNNRKELAIQEDETALVVYMITQYYEYSKDRDFTELMYSKFIKPACVFLSNFIDEQTRLPHASYDLWEEKFLTTTYTTAITAKALLEASTLALEFGDRKSYEVWSSASSSLQNNAEKFYDSKLQHYIKGFDYFKDNYEDTVLDVSSFYGAYKFSYGPQDFINTTLIQIENQLLDKSPSGGAPRYTGDKYFMSEPSYQGNPWFVCTLWLSQYYAKYGEKEKSIKYVDWTIDNTTVSGVLSEQLNPNDSSVVGVTPLVWSHAELINSLIDLPES